MKRLDYSISGFRGEYDFISMFMRALEKKEESKDIKEIKRYCLMNWLLYSGKKKHLKRLLKGEEYIDFSKHLELTARDYPRLTALVMSFSLGYATPGTAARTLEDVLDKRENWCEWIDACWKRNPTEMLKAAIKQRHHYMKSANPMVASARAKALVDRFITTGREPELAGWF